MEEIKFDPKMFISPPYLKCPKCGNETFGVLSIYEQEYLRRCKECFYPRGHEIAERFPLPALNKKIIYLDQHAISEMTKAKKDPSGRKEWRDLYNLIDSLVLNQAIVCPDSQYHEEESELSKSLAEELKKFYEQMSRGISFKSAHQIESYQIYQSLRKFVGEDTSEDYVFSEWAEVFNHNPNAWQGHYSIRVNIRNDPEEVSQRRTRKEKYVEIMQEHFEQLPGKDNFDFKKEVEVCQEAKRYVLLKLYSDYKKGLIEMMIGTRALDFTWFLNSPSIVQLAEGILHFFNNRGISDQGKQRERLKEFVYSEYFNNMPSVRISSLLHAAISRQFVYGTRGKPKSGDYYDVLILSHLLPYCDAMFIDNEFRAIAKENPINLEKQYGTYLFSSTTRDDFITYLQELETQMSPGIRGAIAEVYGRN